MSEAPEIPRSPGLDGIRAVALLAVMAYHAGFSWIPGGFYSLDAFFVLSGYLITSLLLLEWTATSTIVLRRFWARRARRLLPALFALVAALGVFAIVAHSLLNWPDPLGDSLSTLFYVANWHAVASGSGYFAATSPPSPLLHTWSLAIEEQFYLLWPLIVLGILRLSRRRWLLGVVCGVGALGSASWMGFVWAGGAGINHAYYGTDTRAQALLVGAGLAVCLAGRTLPVSRFAGPLLGGIGIVGTGIVWGTLAETSGLAFRGGFLLASLAAAALIAGIVLSPSSPAARLLGLRPLRYLGRISYSAYLWYWPVILVLSDTRLPVGIGWRYVIRTTITFALAAASTRFLEMPIRRGALTGWRVVLAGPAAVGCAFGAVALSTAVAGAVPISVPSLSPQQIAFAHASNRGSAVRILLVGDSMAGSLGAALSTEAPYYRVRIINEGHPGCDVATDAEYQFLLFHNPPGAPCRLGDPDALLRRWRFYVNAFRPQVVVYLGRTDLFNQEFGGRWTQLGDPGFDAFVTSQLAKAVDVLTSDGAHLVLLSSPYYNSTLAGAGPPVPEDTPGRVTIDDAILAAVARDRPRVTLENFARLVDPSGAYQSTVGGVLMRCDDGVHFTRAAGLIIAPALLPSLVKLGHATDVIRPRRRHVPRPPPVPTWYTKLSCP